MFRFITKMFVKETNPILLGRWNRNNDPTITSILTNYDHCGDIICKDPKEAKKLITMEIEKSKNKKFDSK